MNSSCALQSVSEATHVFEQFLKCKFIAPPFEIVNLMVKIAVMVELDDLCLSQESRTLCSWMREKKHELDIEN
jgi:hypothetical protein